MSKNTFMNKEDIFESMFWKNCILRNRIIKIRMHTKQRDPFS